MSWQGVAPPSSDLLSVFDERKVRLSMSVGGASRGRNTAVTSLKDDVDLLLFPNDDTVYPPEFWGRLSELGCERFDLGLFSLRNSEDSSRPSRKGLSAWDGRPLRITRSVLTCAHEPGIVVRRDIFLDAGGFDERIGVGSSTFIQSGEGSELLARLLRRGADVVDLSNVLWATELEQEDGDLLVHKRRRYAAGPAFVLGRHTWLPLAHVVLLRVLFATTVRTGWRGGFAVVRGYRAGRRNGACDNSEL